MKTIAGLSYFLTWLCAECVEAILRPAWRKSLSEFEETVNALDCYPCRVCWDTGDFPQMWIQTGPAEDDPYFGEEFST